MTAQGPVVLLVEDEPQMRKLIRATLAAHNYRLVEAATVAEGRQFATSYNPELVLLDLGLPDGDGIALTGELRTWTRVPIIVLSARGREDDKVQALDAGADDYLTKPFGVNELLARMRATMRRQTTTVTQDGDARIEIGPLRIDLTRREVLVDEREIHLTPIEYRLLVLLAQNAGRVLTHKQILKEVWGPNQVQQTHYVRVHMVELRKKLETDPTRPRMLVTEPGVGYRLRDRPALAEAVDGR